MKAELAYAAAMHAEPRQAEEVEWEDVVGLDREVVTKVRVNQQFFRALIMTGYRSQCAICELPVPLLLVASHITRSDHKLQQLLDRNNEGLLNPRRAR